MSHLFSPAKCILALLLGLIAAPAVANTNGWDWDEEVFHRIWSDPLATWARRVSPVHPSINVIEALVKPPPRELWCVAGVRPTEIDCEIHAELMQVWLEDFAGEAARFDPGTYPAECPSPCYP